MNLATITRKMIQTSAVKLNVATVGALAKFVVEMGINGRYLDELAEHHSQTVNPTELSVSHTIFEAIVVNIPSDYIISRLGLACAVFSAEKVENRVRPMPDVARFFAANDFASLAKVPAVMVALEAHLREVRSTFTEVLERFTTPTNVRKLIRLNDVQGVRMACGKSPLQEFPFGSNSSIVLADRYGALRNSWLKYVGSLLTDSNLLETYGSHDPDAVVAGAEELY